MVIGFQREFYSENPQGHEGHHRHDQHEDHLLLDHEDHIDLGLDLEIELQAIEDQKDQDHIDLDLKIELQAVEDQQDQVEDLDHQHLDHIDHQDLQPENVGYQVISELFISLHFAELS